MATRQLQLLNRRVIKHSHDLFLTGPTRLLKLLKLDSFRLRVVQSFWPASYLRHFDSVKEFAFFDLLRDSLRHRP